MPRGGVLKSSVMIVALMALLAAGCNSPGMRWAHDPNADFAKLKTYAWVEGEQRGVGSGATRGADASTLDQLIVNAVDRELAAKGFTKPPAGADPDFLVTYRAETRYVSTPAEDSSVGWVESRQQQYDNPVPPEVSAGPSRQTDTYTVGTLDARILDARTRRLLWEGTAEQALKENTPADTRRERVNDVIRKLFERFPPQPGQKD